MSRKRQENKYAADDNVFYIDKKSLDKSLKKKIPLPLLDIITAYDEPCSRVPDIYKRCHVKLFNYTDPKTRQTINCENHCLNIHSSLFDKLPNYIETRRLTIDHLEPIFFDGVTKDGRQVVDLTSETLNKLSGHDFKEWEIKFDLTNARNFTDKEDLNKMLDREIPMNSEINVSGGLIELATSEIIETEDTVWQIIDNSFNPGAASRNNMITIYRENPSTLVVVKS